MILGKIKVVIQKDNNSYLEASPLTVGNNIEFPPYRGDYRHIFIRKSDMTSNLSVGDEVTFYGVFDKIPNTTRFNNGFINSKFSPVTEEIFIQLALIYPQTDNQFMP